MAARWLSFAASLMLALPFPVSGETRSSNALAPRTTPQPAFDAANPRATDAAAAAKPTSQPLLEVMAAAARSPRDAAALIALAEAHVAAGSPLEAWAAYREALRVSRPGSGEQARATLGIAALKRSAAREHAAAGDPAGARRWIEEARRLDAGSAAENPAGLSPGSAPAPAASSGAASSRNADLSKARSAAAAGNAPGILAALPGRGLPRSAAELAFLAEAHRLRGDTQRATRLWNRATARDSADPDVLRIRTSRAMAIARTMAERGATEEALRTLDDVDVSAELLLLRARLRLRTSDTDDALRDLEAAERIPGAPALVRTELARLLIASGRLSDLAERFPEAAPGDPRAWRAEAARQTAAGRLDKALAAWGRVLAIAPDDDAAWAEAGRLRAALADTPRALFNYREASRRGNEQATVRLVELLAAAGRRRDGELEVARILHAPRRPSRQALERIALAAGNGGWAEASRQLAAVLTPPERPAGRTDTSPRNRSNASPTVLPNAVTTAVAPESGIANGATRPSTSPVNDTVIIKPAGGKLRTARAIPASDREDSRPGTGGRGETGSRGSVTEARAAENAPAPARPPAPSSPTVLRREVARDVVSELERVDSSSVSPQATSAPGSGPTSAASSETRRLLLARYRSLRGAFETESAARTLLEATNAGLSIPRLELAAAARAAAAARRSDLALALLERIEVTGPLTARELEDRGDALHDRGDIAGAIAAWDRAATPERPAVILKLAEAWQARGEGRRGRQRLSEAAAHAPTDSWRQRLLLAEAQGLLEDGEPEEAKGRLEPLSASGHAEARAWLALAMARTTSRNGLARLAPDPARLPLPPYARGEIAAARGETALAIVLLRTAPIPVSARTAWRVRGRLASSAADRADFARALAGLAEEPGGAATAAIERALLAERAGERETAIGWARATLRLAPGDVEARLEAAGIFWRSGRAGEAVGATEPLVRTLAPGRRRLEALAAHGTALLGLGLAHEAAEALAEARAIGREVAVDPGTMQVVAYNLALAERRRGEPGRALVAIDESGRDDLSARLARAAALIDLDRVSEAIAILEGAASASPVATLNYGILLRLNGLPVDSVRVLRYLAGIWANEALVHYHLATSLEAVADETAARDAYLTAAERERDTELALFFRKEAARLLSPGRETSGGRDDRPGS